MTTENPNPSGQPEHPLIPAGRVNGTAVFSPSGEKIGAVEDLAIDKLSGQVAYAIVRFGGVLGIGERYHPMPWRLLNYDAGRGGYVVPCDRGQLEGAPVIDASELSGWSDAGRRQGIQDFYGQYYPIPL